MAKFKICQLFHNTFFFFFFTSRVKLKARGPNPARHKFLWLPLDCRNKAFEIAVSLNIFLIDQISSFVYCPNEPLSVEMCRRRHIFTRKPCGTVTLRHFALSEGFQQFLKGEILRFQVSIGLLR